MKAYINRALNMKRIKAIGFDMDYTLVKYHTETFEHQVYKIVIEKLIENKKYPVEIRKLDFDFKRVIQGLVLDIRRGNILKLNRYSKVKSSYHGTKKIDFNTQQEIYLNKAIDLSDPMIVSLDTNFSVSYGVLYGQLVDMKDSETDLPSYETIAFDLKDMIDLAHRDDSVKAIVRNNIERYIVQDPELPPMLETYKKQGKKLIIITNSDYDYTKALMDYTFNPYLQEHQDWKELFEITITLSMKPRFFSSKAPFLRVNPETSLMSNHQIKLNPGVYQGGSATLLQKDLGLEASEILYLGDHIFGDVVSLKRTFGWRTALVFEPLCYEVEGTKKGKEIQEQINTLMEEKSIVEENLNELYSRRSQSNQSVSKDKINSLYHKIDEFNQQISKLIDEYQAGFNPYWGEQMRAGFEESRLAGQIDKYACIYMSQVKDLFKYSPRTYFRPMKRLLPHEMI